MQFFLTKDERRLLCEVLRECWRGPTQDGGRAEPCLRLLRKIEGADKRLVIQTEVPLGADDAVTRALEHGC